AHGKEQQTHFNYYKEEDTKSHNNVRFSYTRMSQIAEIEASCSMQPLSLSADKKFPVCPEYDRQNPFYKDQQKSSQALILSSHRLSPLLFALVGLTRFPPEDPCTTVRTRHAAGAAHGAFRDVYFCHTLEGKKIVLFMLLLEASSSRSLKRLSLQRF